MTLLSNKRPVRYCLIAAFLTITLLFASTVPAAEKQSVSIQPFAINAPDDLSYLQNGVRAMLSSRLSANGGATVIDAGADYIVTGSITSLGESISLDAKVTSASTGAAESFYSSAAGQNDIIAAITDLSWQISEKIFGKQRPAQHVVTVPAGRASGSAQGEPAATAQTPHPEKTFISRTTYGTTATSALVGPTVREAARFTKLPNFEMNLKGMDIGDVDGDGLADIVVVGNKEMVVYRNLNGRYDRMTSYPMSSRYLPHGISVADLNNNGKAEIYISAADYENPGSIGLEWNGNSFSTLFSNAPWYIRTATLPGYGMTLIGQRTETSAAFRAGIFRLQRQGNSLVPEEKIYVPDYVNLFDFSMDDIDGDGSPDIIAISQTDTLYVLRANGSLAWQSDDQFGGVTRYVGGEGNNSEYSAIDTDQETEADGQEEKYARVYIPSRIITTDLNGDGIKDVLVNKNLSTASRIFKRMKHYPSGEIYGLTWDGIGLAELWRSRKINGYVADYQILPGKDGKPATLFVAVILKSGWLGTLAAPESTVLMYTLK